MRQRKLDDSCGRIIYFHLSSRMNRDSDVFFPSCIRRAGTDLLCHRWEAVGFVVREDQDEKGDLIERKERLDSALFPSFENQVCLVVCDRKMKHNDHVCRNPRAIDQRSSPLPDASCFSSDSANVNLSLQSNYLGLSFFSIPTHQPAYYWPDCHSSFSFILLLAKY